MTADVDTLAQQGVAALRRGHGKAARDAFLQVEATGRGTHQLRLLLAQACVMVDDRTGAHRALDRVIADEPDNLYALIMRGDMLTRAGDPRAAVSWYQAALTHAPRLGTLPSDLVEALGRAERAVADAGTAFQTHLDERLASAGIDLGETGQRFAEALDILAGRAQVQLQQPTNFYYPSLPQRTFYDRAEFDWVEPLEAAGPAIRAELKAVLADQTLEPYVAADADRPSKRHPLLGDTRWSAFHLYRQGIPTEQARARCPETLRALERLPLPRIAGRSPMALFSVLHPGTHIPPHHGMLNTRLICHLPLIVPPGCALRVGNQRQAVEQDRMMIFDDSIEHEAWNNGNATRVVLLFEVWRPELDEGERTALTALFEAIGLYAPIADDQAGA